MIVFIDGENFRQRLSETLANSGVITDKKEAFKFNLVGMLEEVLKTKKLNIRYYASEIKMLRGYTPSNNMQKQVALIKAHLRTWVGEIKRQNIKYIKAGNLKVKEAKPCFKCKAQQEVLQEKGVDVRLALDIFETSLDKRIKEIAVVSSDTDICPAYHKAKKCGVKIKYICFEGALNRGVAAATDETIKIPTYS